MSTLSFLPGGSSRWVSGVLLEKVPLIPSGMLYLLLMSAQGRLAVPLGRAYLISQSPGGSKAQRSLKIVQNKVVFCHQPVVGLLLTRHSLLDPLNSRSGPSCSPHP